MNASETCFTVFLVNHHHNPACGVYQMGSLIARIVAHSRRHRFLNVEANSAAELAAAADTHGAPDVVIYNSHPGVLGWAFADRPFPGAVHVGTVHEGCPNPAIVLDGSFPFWIWHDPSIEGRGDIPANLFIAVRPLPTLTRPVEVRPGTLGTFGFPIGGKGFEAVIAYARETGLPLRMLLPDCWYFGAGASEEYRACLRSLAADLPDTEIDTAFRTPEEVVCWLAANEQNALLNPLNHGRGISSSLDFLIAAGRPMVLSDSTQFRHVHRFYGYDDSDHPTPARHTYDPLPLQMAWHPNQLVLDYERVVDTVTGGAKR